MKNNILELLNTLCFMLAITHIEYAVKIAKSGSVYIKLKRINAYIRISDHRKYDKTFFKYNIRSDVKTKSMVRFKGTEKYIYPIEAAEELFIKVIFYEYLKRGYCEKRKKSTLHRDWNKAVEMFSVREESSTPVANML